LQDAIGRGRKVEMDVGTDPELLGGLVVRIGNAIVDLSLKTKLNRIAQEAMGS
jgi:F-type H+-transporting ATPase subunit delta